MWYQLASARPPSGGQMDGWSTLLAFVVVFGGLYLFLKVFPLADLRKSILRVLIKEKNRYRALTISEITEAVWILPRPFMLDLHVRNVAQRLVQRGFLEEVSIYQDNQEVRFKITTEGELWLREQNYGPSVQ